MEGALRKRSTDIVPPRFSKPKHIYQKRLRPLPDFLSCECTTKPSPSSPPSELHVPITSSSYLYHPQIPLPLGLRTNLPPAFWQCITISHPCSSIYTRFYGHRPSQSARRRTHRWGIFHFALGGAGSKRLVSVALHVSRCKSKHECVSQWSRNGGCIGQESRGSGSCGTSRWKWDPSIPPLRMRFFKYSFHKMRINCVCRFPPIPFPLDLRTSSLPVSWPSTLNQSRDEPIDGGFFISRWEAMAVTDSSAWQFASQIATERMTAEIVHFWNYCNNRDFRWLCRSLGIWYFLLCFLCFVFVSMSNGSFF